MHRFLLSSTLLAALCAGEAAPSATLAIADGDQLVQHWNASLYGKVWKDPGLAWVRQQWTNSAASWVQERGFDVEAILATAKGFRAEFLGLSAGAHPLPRIRAQVDLGAQALPCFALWTKDALPQPETVAGADEARRLAQDGPVLARFGTRLVLGWNTEALPQAPAPVATDLRFTMDYRAFMKAIQSIMPDTGPRDEFDRMLTNMDSLMGNLSWDVGLVPQGLHEVMLYDKTFPGMLPVDRLLIDRFPANALAVAGCGLDAALVWKTVGPTYLDSLDQMLHRGRRQGAERTQAEIDTALAELGVPGGLKQLLADLKGTFALAVTPAAPFPGVTLVVPRSPAIDALVTAGLAQMQAQPPAVGTSAILPIPNVPLMITLARDAKHWVLTSDAACAEAWLSGKPGGFLGSATGKALVAQAPAQAYLLGGLDTAATIRTVTPYAAMGLARMPNEARQAILTGLNRFAAESGPSVLWAALQAGQSRTEAQGPLGMGVVPIAIIAAIAIPNLMESRVTANEAAAGATLKAGIFPAQIQFQAGGYMDQDADNIGEYGTLAELSGRLKTSKMEAGSIRLLQGPLAQGDTASGYHYRMYLPDGKGGAFSSDDAVREALPAAANDQERYFLAVAWPVSHDTGRRMFALGQDGQLRSLPWDGKEPDWKAVMPGGWKAQPAWPAQNSGRVRHQIQAPEPEPAEPVPAPSNLF